MPIGPFDVVIYALCIAVAIILVGAAAFLVVVVLLGVIDDRRERLTLQHDTRRRPPATHGGPPAGPGPATAPTSLRLPRPPARRITFDDGKP